MKLAHPDTLLFIQADTIDETVQYLQKHLAARRRAAAAVPETIKETEADEVVSAIPTPVGKA